MRASEKRRLSWLIATVATLILAPAALAQSATSCPEGKTLSGECVNPGLAAGARQAAILFSQPLISYTAYPVLPVEDARTRYPGSVNPPQNRPPLGGGIPFGTGVTGAIFTFSDTTLLP